MGDDAREAGGKRKYDDRSAKVLRLIEGLVGLGVVPRTVEVDGVRVEVAAYASPGAPHLATGNAGARVLDDAAPLTSADDDRPGRSYRAQAREELRRRMAGREA